MKIIDLKMCNYFPSMAIIFAAFMVPVSLLLLFVNVIVALVLLLGCVVAFTTQYRLRIDFEKKEYFDYVSFLGFKSGERGQFDTVQYLFIKSKRVTQNLNGRVSSLEIRKEVFDGYLKFSDEDKIHITTEDIKNTLVKKLRVMSNQLDVKIIDYTEGDPKVIY